ncbi:uncharacterized protein LOC143707661 [Siphateles boraxobius]|uniref:uncharacterized protein LOC143707661 n=1 Tax=Siphateles boraxobius TaxID=180520 RepID=UPI004063827E
MSVKFPLDLESLFEDSRPQSCAAVFAGRSLNTTEAWEDHTTGSSLIIPLVLVPLGLIFAGLLLRFLFKKCQSRGNMQKVNIMHATLPEGMDISSSDVFVDAYEYLPEGMDSSSAPQPSTSAAVLLQERPQTPGQEPTPATDALETEPMVDYAQPSTSAAVLLQERPQTPGQEPTPATDALETEPMVDYAQPSTSAAVLLQERPQTPGQEPTPATDALETKPMVDYAQPSTSAAVLSERNPSRSPTDRPVKINPTGSFDSFYELGKKLASRSHGIVHEGIRKSDDKQVIIKFVKKRRFDFHIGHSEPLCREAAIMRIMRHSNHVVKLYDWFDMEDHNILVMEHPGTSMTLCDFIKENEGRLTEAVAKDIMQKLIAAFRLCSERGVYYKDMSLSKVLIDPDTMQIKLTGFYRALTIFETQTAKSKSALVRRFHALFATNEGLYRVLKGMVEANSLKLWFGWKNTRLSKECQDLLRKLRDRESEITLQNILDHDWFKKTPGTDALESDGNMQFEGMDSSSAQPSSRSPTDVPAQNDPTGREGRPRLAAVKRGFQSFIGKVCPCVPEPSQERPQTPGQEPRPAEPTDLTLRFPRQPTLQHKYFRCLYKVGKNVGYDDRVHEGIRRSDGQKVAIKFVERCRLWETSPKFVEEGTSLLKMQKRPTCDHSVRLYERFILEDQTALVMEHLPAYVTLREFIRGNGGSLTDETANRIMSQIHVAIRHWTDNDLSYPLLKRLILINPKTLHIKYAHLAEKEFSRIEETDEDLRCEYIALFFMEKHNKDPLLEHVPDAKYYLTAENLVDHPLFADLDIE